MASLRLPVKIYWSVAPVDIRKSFDSLSALVAEHLGHDPLSGHLFVFTSRRRDRVKLLYFEKGGLTIWYKRLEEGTFAAPKPSSNGKSAQLSAEDLSLRLAGVDLTSERRRKRFERVPA